MRNQLCICLGLALGAVAPVSAQVATANSPLGMGARPYTFDLSDGEPISWFLEYSYELKLTPEQKTTLFSIRRRLRSDNDHYMERLDSVADAVGLTLGERSSRMTPDERDALQRFNRLTQATRDSIRANNAIARAEALTLLTKPQTARLDSLMSVLQRERGGRPRRGQDARGGGSGS